MRNRAFVVSIVGVVAGATILVAQNRATTSPLVGVWRVAERTSTGPNARTVTDPQPGILIVTAHYYSTSIVTSDAPRPDLPRDAADKQRLDAWGAFGADAGTYEVHGSELTSHPITHKNPNRMREGTFETDTIRLEATTRCG